MILASFFVNHHHFNYSLAPIKRKFPFFINRHQKCRRKWLFWPLTLPSNGFSIAATLQKMRSVLRAAHIWNASNIKATSTYLCSETHRKRKLCKQKTILTGEGIMLLYRAEKQAAKDESMTKMLTALGFICFGNEMITSMASKALSWHYVWFNSKVLLRFCVAA